MDKQKFFNILNSDIDRFISNYLIDGNLDELIDADKVNLYITDSFPYLSTLHLIYSNYDSKDADNFAKKYESILGNETKQLRLLLGYFLCDHNELESLKHQLCLLQKENDEKTAKIQLLNEEVITLKGQKHSLENDIIILHEEKERLVKKIAELEWKFQVFCSDHHLPKDSNIDNTTMSVPSDLIDMGTSVLWGTRNLGSEKEYENGDYFSWGALNSAEYFGSDVWGYTQIIKKNISGLPECDAARLILGEGYRIPTAKEWKELLEICDNNPRTITIKGCKYVKLLSSKTNKQLLLPIIGHVESDVCNDDIAQYWTSEQYTGKSAYICQINEINSALSYAQKWCGLPIRPVFDKSNKPLILDENDRMRLKIEDTNNRIHISFIKKTFDSLFLSRTTSNLHSKKYPAKSEINESTIFNLLIKDCLPYGKSIFEGDIIRNINLDITKLNEILTKNYFVGPIAKYTVDNMTIKRFKIYLLHLLSK